MTFGADATARTPVGHDQNNDNWIDAGNAGRLPAVTSDPAQVGAVAAIRAQVQMQPPVPLVDVSVRAASATVVEGSAAVFRIHASTPVAVDLEVGWRVERTAAAADVDAASSNDFSGQRLPAGSAVIAAGESITDVRIVVLEDNVEEKKPERFTFSLRTFTAAANAVQPQRYRGAPGADGVVVDIEPSSQIAAPSMSFVAAIAATGGYPIVVRDGEAVAASPSRTRPAEDLPLYYRMGSRSGYISRNFLDRDPARPGLQVREGDTVTFFSRIIYRLESRYAGTYIYDRRWSGDAFNAGDLQEPPPGGSSFLQVIVDDIFAENVGMQVHHTVTVTDDSAIEGEEIVTLRLDNWRFNFLPVPSDLGFDLRDVSATFTILASDGPQYRIVGPAPAAEVREGATLTVVVQSDVSATDEVLCTIIPGAGAGVPAAEDDFFAATASAVFTAQTTASCEFAVVVDYREEPYERFAVALSAPAGGGAPGAAYGVARDFRIADFAPPLTITGTERVFEGGTATYSVSVPVALPLDVAVHWNVGAAAGAASAAPGDFGDGAGMRLARFPTGTVIIPAGGDGATFPVYVFDDRDAEYAEQFFVSARGVADREQGSVLSAASSAATTIERSDGTNYDLDGDGLIDVATTSQLSAIRHDLNGRGIEGVSDANRADYQAAFDFFDAARTCPSTCTGYELSGDLDLSGAGDWTPIGGGVGYAGTFEGNGFVISGMEIASGKRLSNAGLFGVLGAAGEIRNVGLRDVAVDVDSQSAAAGALAGRNNGRIAASYAAGGSVRSGYSVGGLVGANTGTVIACYADVAVHAKNSGGSAGGLIGFQGDAGVVSASYSIGKPTGSGGATGGLVGERESAGGGAIQGSYFDRERGAQASCCGGQNVPSPDETPRTSAELRGPTTATGTIYAGWDRLNLDAATGTVMGAMTLHDDAPWDFGTSFQYPVLVFGGDEGRRPARRTSQQAAQPALSLTPAFDGSEAASEGGTAIYTVRLPVSLPLGVTASWGWAAGGGTVGAGDFGDVTGSRVVIAPGRSSASFSLAVAADGVAELEEIFEVSLGDARLAGAPGNVRLGVPGSAVRTTIAANELGQITVAAESPTVAEGATATFTLRLSGGNGESVVVEFEVAAASGELTPADLARMTWVDGTAARSRRVGTLPATGSVTLRTADIATVSVAAAVDDVAGESGERFGLRLTRCRDCGDVYPVEIGVPSSARVTISRTPLTVSARVYLQGAYVSESSGMRTTLARLLPTSQPYGAAPWNYRSPTTVPHVDESGLGRVTSTLVDWVLVELRASAPGAGASAALPTTGGLAAGLLLRDGRIAGIDEAAPTPSAALSLDGVRVAAGFPRDWDVYVLVHHRNHLPVMSARPATTRSGGCGAHYCVDFRNAQSYEGCAQLCGADGVCRMIAGDVNRSGGVSWGDDGILLRNAGTVEYTETGANYMVDADLDFSGGVSFADVRVILANNLLTSECTP